VQEDMAALGLRQREALNEVTAAAAAPSAYQAVRGEETRATRPMSNQVPTHLHLSVWHAAIVKISSPEREMNMFAGTGASTTARY
jgi:hypothetical protein